MFWMLIVSNLARTMPHNLIHYFPIMDITLEFSSFVKLFLLNVFTNKNGAQNDKNIFKKHIIGME
jgi:uncharacterized protein YhhL (DUF1145 family)